MNKQMNKNLLTLTNKGTLLLREIKVLHNIVKIQLEKKYVHKLAQKDVYVHTGTLKPVVNVLRNEVTRFAFNNFVIESNLCDEYQSELISDITTYGKNGLI
jgi:hypothetical protein